MSSSTINSSQSGSGSSSNIPPPPPPRPAVPKAASSPPVEAPALPARHKSVDQLLPSTSKSPPKKTTTSSNPDIEEYYAHLGKHVKEVRRRKAKHLVAPSLSDYRVKKDGKTISTNWIEFIQAWIKYFVSAAAYDEVNRPLEPFSLKTVKHDLDRLYPMVVPLIAPVKKLRPIYRWENKALTGGLASLYLILWYYDLIMAFVCIWMAIGILVVRLDMFAQYGVEALEEQPETDATVKSWNHNFWMKMRTTMGTRSPYGFNLFDDIDISVNEWKTDLYTKYGPTIQIILSDTVDYLERIKNLLTWKRPLKTRILLFVICTSSVFLTFIPLRYVGKMTFFYLGFEFFVLQALRSHYPRHRRLFNILNLLLWDVPNDAEYAMEVVRLSRPIKVTSNDSTSSASSTSTSTSTSADLTRRNLDYDSSTGPRHPPSAMPKKLSASMSDLMTDHLTMKALDVKPTNKSPGKTAFHEQAASTATSLAMLAAAAAVNKVKKTVDGKRDKNAQRAQDSIPPEEEDDPNAFGCMYKGTIPGRINLRGNGFVFQTSRMTGGKVLVECAFDDIVGVKKTKQYDMLVWHANGIDISTTDGHVLKFENVLRRDDCFNRLVAASDAGGEWKKM
ncbi:hypothetical protein V8B55DRAFT_1504990 [Mucor lusitanicus]|uniref:GRAM domain-containing protein n=2 Tax=Mucor circinelloides f. lusitanicus TaxID=29924 RepID=A0A168Q6P1_MUCCL|nr:hypothetical protein FB192DRAFT_1367860 [Mucor lusitanicus]OAD08778.1 hypothetical protein MUCCIDRAFT_76344 [Mucor lusitanicus CBS 277.49]